MKIKDEREWMFQAEYDLHAAEKMFEAGIYAYAVFMCHLSIEKALKAIYFLKFSKAPPKIHDLKTIANFINLKIPDDLEPFVAKLTDVSVPARYPEDLKRALQGYDKNKTRTILANSKKVLTWAKKELVQK